MSDVAALQTVDSFTSRPFTCPAKTEDDLSLLRRLLAGLRALLENLSPTTGDETPQLVVESKDEGRPVRYVFNNLSRLRYSTDAIVVGFFGQRCRRVSEVQMNEISEMDQKLVAELQRHPGILAYCSAEKADGDWGNLILFSQFDDLKTLADSAPHTRAAKTLSPDYYDSTRIHDGILPGAIMSDAQPVLRRTRYWDFSETPPWRGEQVYEE